MTKYFYLLLAFAFFCSFPAPAHAGQDSAYERVMKTGTLRCGYAPWPGLLEVDPNTKAMSGPAYDFMEELGKAMQIKIIWQEEVGFGDMVESLRTGRTDAHCSGAWTNAVRGKFIDHTTPLFYNPLYAYVRADDTRFDKKIQDINSPVVTISLVDGESAQTIAESDFPRAKTFSLPKGSEGTQMLLNVITGKADVTFTDPEMFHKFELNNPGKLKKIPAPFPIRLFGVSLWVAKGENALLSSLDTGINQLLWTGVFDRILDQYESTPGAYVRAAMPYRTGK